MKNNILKSVVAIIIGIVIGAVLSIGTDKILEATGVLPYNNLFVATWLILAVLAYRTIFNILGCYFAARLAPSHPMRHALILGIIGTIVSIGGAIATSNMNLGPAWYAWTLAALSLPSAWVGGKLAVMTRKNEIKSI